LELLFEKSSIEIGRSVLNMFNEAMGKTSLFVILHSLIPR